VSRPETDLNATQQFEDDIEAAIVAAAKREVPSRVMSGLLDDYRRTLDELGHVPTTFHRACRRGPPADRDACRD
jgi:hypothetical protein